MIYLGVFPQNTPCDVCAIPQLAYGIVDYLIVVVEGAGNGFR